MRRQWAERLRTCAAMIACWLPFTGMAQEAIPVGEEHVDKVVSDTENEWETTSAQTRNASQKKKAKRKTKKKAKRKVKKGAKKNTENKILYPDQTDDLIPGDERIEPQKLKLPENENLDIHNQ